MLIYTNKLKHSEHNISPISTEGLMLLGERSVFSEIFFQKHILLSQESKYPCACLAEAPDTCQCSASCLLPLVAW